jgi:hypothetical protein
VIENMISKSGRAYKMSKDASPVWDARSYLPTEFLHIASIVGTIVHFSNIMIWPHAESITARHRMDEYVSYSLCLQRYLNGDKPLRDIEYTIRIENMDRPPSGGFSVNTLRTWNFHNVRELDFALKDIQSYWETLTLTGEWVE